MPKKKEVRSKSPNARVWEKWGISAEAHEKCDRAMPLLLEGIRVAEECAERVMAEAVSQFIYVPKQPKKIREELAWKDTNENMHVHIWEFRGDKELVKPKRKKR